MTIFIDPLSNLTLQRSMATIDTGQSRAIRSKSLVVVTLVIVFAHLATAGASSEEMSAKHAQDIARYLGQQMKNEKKSEHAKVKRDWAEPGVHGRLAPPPSPGGNNNWNGGLGYQRGQPPPYPGSAKDRGIMNTSNGRSSTGEQVVELICTYLLMRCFIGLSRS